MAPFHDLAGQDGNNGNGLLIGATFVRESLGGSGRG